MSKEMENSDWGIYIGNIPHNLTKEHIENLFQKYNIVKAYDLVSKGAKLFCFMKLASEADVMNAIAQMNNHNLNGRKLQIRQLDKRSGFLKEEQKCNNDSKYSLTLTAKDIPPLETPVMNQNVNVSPGALIQQSKTNYSNDKFQVSGCISENSSPSWCNQTPNVLPQVPSYKYQNSFSSGSNLASCMSPQPSGSSDSCLLPPTSRKVPGVHHHCSSFTEPDKTLHISPNKNSTPASLTGQNIQISPKCQSMFLKSSGQSKQLPSPNQSTSSLRSSQTPQVSTNLDQSSHESPEKHRYVHCTRNVISYNPRALENNKINYNLSEHSPSKAVKVWVANFPFGTTQNQMLKLFEDFSPLKAYINNNSPGRDFTRATIILPSLDIAESAIMELDNTIYRRRTLLVGLVEDDDEFVNGYEDDDEDYDDEYYYEPYGNSYEQDNQSRYYDQERLYNEPVSRFQNIRIS